MAQTLRDDLTQSITSICRALGLSHTTFYRYTIAKSEASNSRVVGITE